MKVDFIEMKIQLSENTNSFIVLMGFRLKCDTQK